MNRSTFFLAFILLSIVWGIFVSLNPLLVLSTRKESFQIINPEISISANNRMIILYSNGKEYVALCAYFKSEEAEFCKEGSRKIVNVNGFYEYSKYVKNKKSIDVVIDGGAYVEDGKEKSFFIEESKIKDWERTLNFTNKYLPYFFFFLTYGLLIYFFIKNRK